MFDAALVAAAHGHVQGAEVADLFRARYDSVTTVGEAFAGCLLGLGVAEAVDGEIVAFDNTVWRVPADGLPVIADADLGLPFAVSATGAPGAQAADVPVSAGDSFLDLAALITEAMVAAGAEDPHHVAAVRLDGSFRDVLLRSERRQEPPYEPLPQVLADEIRFPFGHWQGTLVGFRFPDLDDGLVIPGLHLHGIAADRRSEGHCHQATVVEARMRVWVDDLEITVPHDKVAAALAGPDATA